MLCVMKCDCGKVLGNTDMHRASQILGPVESRWKLQRLAQRGNYQIVTSYLLRLTEDYETFLPLVNLVSVFDRRKVFVLGLFSAVYEHR